MCFRRTLYYKRWKRFWKDMQSRDSGKIRDIALDNDKRKNSKIHLLMQMHPQKDMEQ